MFPGDEGEDQIDILASGQAAVEVVEPQRRKLYQLQPAAIEWRS